jgi:1-deoxy-D-xylulose-5-phosphate reductoisomerase
LKKIIILGATGSIGTSALDVVRTHPNDFRVVAMAVRTNKEAGEKLASEFSSRLYVGEDSALRAVEENDADIVLASTVGLSGLAPVLAAIEKGIDVALATKEVLVAAGELVTMRAKEKGVRLIPVDSEHSAVFQCLQGKGEVERLILTASGGPFLDAPEDLSKVTVAMALKHPRWKMGAKVTIDSSTMMNKGFEILEARWLFDIPLEKIDVLVHPESIVHSMVTFKDGATLAQLSPPDMRVPIQYAFSWPERLPAEREVLDLASTGALNFRKYDPDRFPCLALVASAYRRGATAPAILSAADEIAVERFLSEEIKYTDIARLVSDALENVPNIPASSIENIFAADSAARKYARQWKS